MKKLQEELLHPRKSETRVITTVCFKINNSYNTYIYHKNKTQLLPCWLLYSLICGATYIAADGGGLGRSI